MKKFFTLLLTCGIVLGLSAQNNIQLPNASFEQWTNYVTYEDPNQWFCPNNITSLLCGAPNVTKGTVGAENGNYFVNIKNLSFGKLVIPSAINLGQIDINIDDLSSPKVNIGDGIDFSSSSEAPKSLTGYYKFENGGNDIATIALFGYNKTDKGNDTIATGVVKISDNMATWTKFDLAINYKDGKPSVPQYLNVVIANLDFYFNDGKQIVLKFFSDYSLGTNLSVDNLSLMYSDGIKNIANSDNFNVYVSNGILNIINTPVKNSNAQINIFNMAGQIVFNGNASEGSQINMNNFNKGMYIIRMTENNISYSKKFILE